MSLFGSVPTTDEVQATAASSQLYACKFSTASYSTQATMSTILFASGGKTLEYETYAGMNNGNLIMCPLAGVYLARAYAAFNQPADGSTRGIQIMTAGTVLLGAAYSSASAGSGVLARVYVHALFQTGVSVDVSVQAYSPIASDSLSAVLAVRKVA